MTKPPPTCPVCKGALCYHPADINGPERVTCKACGWYTEKRDTGKSLTEIEKERREMSKCKVEGCEKNAQINGQCKSHAKGSKPRDVKKADWTPPVKTETEPVPEKKLLRSHDFERAPVVTPAKRPWAIDGETLAPETITPDPRATSIDLVELFKAEQAAELQLFIDSLEKLEDPKSRLIFASTIISGKGER